MKKYLLSAIATLTLVGGAILLGSLKNPEPVRKVTVCHCVKEELRPNEWCCYKYVKLVVPFHTKARTLHYQHKTDIILETNPDGKCPEASDENPRCF